MSECEQAVKEYVKKHGSYGATGVIRQLSYIARHGGKLEHQIEQVEEVAADLEKALKKCEL